MAKIQLKLLVAFSVLVALIVAMSGFLLERSLHERELAATQKRLLHESELARELLGDRPFEPGEARELLALARRIAAITGARVTLIRSDGQVVVDSDLQISELDRVANHGDRPEVRDALGGRIGLARRESMTVGRELLYVGVPRPIGDRVDVLRLAVDLEAVDAAIRSALARDLGVASLIGFLAILALSLLCSTIIVRPLEGIRESVRAIAGGALQTRVPWRSNDELGEISRAIDQMAIELERTIAEIVEEKEQLDAVLAGMAEGVLVLDDDGKIVLANRRLRELLALPRRIEGESPIAVFRSPELDRILEEAMLSGAAVGGELQLAERVFEVQAVALGGDHRAGLVAVFHDVSELRRLEAVRRDFVANASHELRTPLTAIRGFAETLVESRVSAEDRKRYTQIVLDHAKRVEALIDDLLELSRIESAGFELTTHPVDISDVADRAIARLQPVFESREVTVVHRRFDGPKVVADSSALEQVFSNLLENAAKYADAGGRVEITYVAEGSWVRTSVRDTGVGIPLEHQARIFERFYRVDKARSRELGGTGLGLAIVRNSLEAMGGSIRVESQPGLGSTFTFQLPRA